MTPAGLFAALWGAGDDATQDRPGLTVSVRMRELATGTGGYLTIYAGDTIAAHVMAVVYRDGSTAIHQYGGFVPVDDMRAAATARAAERLARRFGAAL